MVIDDVKKLMGADGGLIDKIVDMSKLTGRENIDKSITAKLLLDRFGSIAESAKDGKLTGEEYQNELMLQTQFLRNTIGAMQKGEWSTLSHKQIRDMAANYFDEQRKGGEYDSYSDVAADTAKDKIKNLDLTNFAKSLTSTNFTNEYLNSKVGSYADWSLANFGDEIVGRGTHFAGEDADDMIATEKSNGIGLFKTDQIIQLTGSLAKGSAEQVTAMKDLNTKLAKLIELQQKSNQIAQEAKDQSAAPGEGNPVLQPQARAYP